MSFPFLTTRGENRLYTIAVTSSSSRRSSFLYSVCSLFAQIGTRPNEGTQHVDLSAVVALERAGLIAKRLSAPSVAEVGGATAARSEDEVARFIKGQKRLSDLLNEHLGFRGYMMMMRLQRAENLRDLHDLLPDFAKALVKRIGIEKATPIVSELERLIVG